MSTNATGNSEPGVTSADASRPSGSFFKNPIAVSASYAEQGLQGFNRELRSATSVSAPPAARDVCNEGGIPSSPAFATEQATDAQRFAALDLETRDQALSLSSQMKCDFLLAQSAPSVPPGFAVGPSNATRTVSRSASMASELVDGAADVAADDADATPLILANHKEVSKMLHLAGPPTVKAGQKEKAETAVAAAARANGNITRLGGKIIALEARVEKHELLADSHARACQTRHRAVNIGKLEDRIDVVGAESHNGIENLEARIQALAAAGAGVSSDPRVSLHSTQIGQLTDSLNTVKRALDRLTEAFLCDVDGVPIKHFATKGDIGGLWDSVQESFDGLDLLVDERLAPTIQKVGGAADLVAKLDAQVARLETHDAKREHDIVTARENIARLQIDFAAAVTSAPRLASTVVTPAAVAPAAVTPAAVTAPTPTVALTVVAPTPADARPASFSIGGKKLKRKPSVELIAAPAKCVNARPDKGAYHHWTRVGPVNPDNKVAAPALFRKLVETVAIKDYSLPAVYIERATGEPSILNVGFTTANDASTFVSTWSAATFSMPAGLREITAQHMVTAGSSRSNDTISFLTGN
ncbi:hypothetical protein B0H12DRAFT_1231012 [Mycena haematopus]|nr:hypothetical protein B0H12DRAFT_1231012 [Mycena haematopus]